MIVVRRYQSALAIASLSLLNILNVSCNRDSPDEEPVRTPDMGVDLNTAEVPRITDRPIKREELDGSVFYLARIAKEHVSLFEYDISGKTLNAVADVPAGLKAASISRDGRFFFYTGPVWENDFYFNVVIMGRSRNSGVFKEKARFPGSTLPGEFLNLFYDDWEKKLYLFFRIGNIPPEERSRRVAYDKAREYVFYSDEKYSYVTAFVDLNTEPYELQFLLSPIGRSCALSEEYVYLTRAVNGREYLLQKKRTDIDSEAAVGSVLLPKHVVGYVVLNGNTGLLVTVYEKEYRNKKTAEAVYYMPFFESSAKSEEKVFCRRLQSFHKFTPIKEPEGRGLIVEVFSVEKGGYRPLEAGEYTGRVFFLDFYNWRLTWLFDYKYREYEDLIVTDNGCVAWIPGSSAKSVGALKNFVSNRNWYY